MSQKVAKEGIKREKGWLYYIDRQGNVSRKRMARGGSRKQNLGKAEVVCKAGIRREEGYLYFIDKQGDISRAKMVRKKASSKKKR